jgi:MFS transporter, SP family, general alpha glucoside:H+ symporter
MPLQVLLSFLLPHQRPLQDLRIHSFVQPAAPIANWLLSLTMATAQDPSKLESARPASVTTDAHLTQHQLIENAANTAEEENKLPRMELFRRYRPAAIYSGLLSIALVMEGMDVGLINNFFAHPAYRKKFGNDYNVDGELVVSTQWQTIIGAGNNVGSIIGLLLNGWLQSRYGSRRVYLVSSFATANT